MDNISSGNNKGYLTEQFESVERYMRAHITDRIGLYELSKGCHMSVSKISSLFQLYCGCTPIAYFNMLRIDEAKRYIKDGKLNMTQISELLGFSSSQYFSKLFKKYVGITPTEYQRKHLS